MFVMRFEDIKIWNVIRAHHKNENPALSFGNIHGLVDMDMLITTYYARCLLLSFLRFA
jgi:hypothetical protein